jgi:misshapen/NIK-related kinase
MNLFLVRFFFKLSFYFQINVNVMPTQLPDLNQDTPEIRKYRKKFNSDILCAALWGVNLLIGTENSLMLLDRSGQGKGKE